MNRPTLIASAATLDLLLGDPESLPHPVRTIGSVCTRAEAILRRPAQPPAVSLAAGAILTATIVLGTYATTATALRLTRRIHPFLGNLTELALASTTLATRNLLDESRSVLQALDGHGLPEARRRLARIVGRDTASLPPHDIARALIETLAESLSDGIVAPLFYLTLGGVPLAMAFKAVSTLDSMIGHRTPEYLYFGRPAARLDDFANLIPARLTALLLLATHPTRRALRIYLRDHSLHASPNAGHPEAAVAAVLGVQLGGPSTYDGIPHRAPILAHENPLPTPADAHRAHRLIFGAALFATAATVILAHLVSRRKPHGLPA